MKDTRLNLKLKYKDTLERLNTYKKKHRLSSQEQAINRLLDSEYHDKVVDASKSLIESVKMANDFSIKNGRGKIISPYMAAAIARLNLALKVKEQ